MRSFHRASILFGLAGLCLGAAIVLAAGRITSRTGDVLTVADRQVEAVADSK